MDDQTSTLPKQDSNPNLQTLFQTQMKLIQDGFYIVINTIRFPHEEGVFLCILKKIYY